MPPKYAFQRAAQRERKAGGGRAVPSLLFALAMSVAVVGCQSLPAGSGAA